MCNYLTELIDQYITPSLAVLFCNSNGQSVYHFRVSMQHAVDITNCDVNAIVCVVREYLVSKVAPLQGPMWPGNLGTYDVAEWVPKKFQGSQNVQTRHTQISRLETTQTFTKVFTFH